MTLTSQSTNGLQIVRENEPGIAVRMPDLKPENATGERIDTRVKSKAELVLPLVVLVECDNVHDASRDVLLAFEAESLASPDLIRLNFPKVL